MTASWCAVSLLPLALLLVVVAGSMCIGNSAALPETTARTTASTSTTVQAPVLMRPSQPVLHDIPKFVFIKTHKTGSSSISIMLGYAIEKRGMKPAVPCSLAFGYPHDWRSFTYSLCGRDKLNFTGVISHLRWTEVTRNTLLPVMGPEKPVIFTIARDPISRFISAVRFYGNQEFRTLTNWTGTATDEWMRFALEQLSKESVREQIPGFMPQWHLIGYAFDFGLQDEYEPEPTEAFYSAAKKFIDSLDFVLLYEEWDLSMAILKEHLKLSLHDVIYPHLKKTGRSQVELSPQTRELFCKVLWSDCVLFDLMKQRFRNTIDQHLLREARAIQGINKLAHERGEVPDFEDEPKYYEHLRETFGGINP